MLEKQINKRPFPMKDGRGNTVEVWVDEPLYRSLSEMDSKTAQNDWEWEHNIDYLTETRKKYSENPNSDYSIDPIDCIPDYSLSPEYLLFDQFEAQEHEELDKERRDRELAAVHEEIEKLQPQQKELLEKRKTMTQQQIADETGKTQQSVYNREVKIRNRVEKGMELKGMGKDYFNRHRR